MKRNDFFALLQLCAMPVILMVLGLILLLNPDSAAVLVSTVIAWILLCSGVGYGLYGILGGSYRRVTRLLTGVFCLALGGMLLGNPLFLARNIGRVLGIVLAVEGIENLRNHSVSKAMAILTLVGAVVLVLAPMTASRLVFSLCGLILLVIGAAQLAERLRRRRLNGGSGDDPNIIDAL